MRFVFLGPPGAGKGTQAGQVARHLELFHIATGDMLRKAAETGSPFGLEAKKLMDKGELIPDELTNRLVDEAIWSPSARKGFVLDGYPRNEAQAEYLQTTLAGRGANLDKVIRFMIKGDEIVARLSGRRVCPRCESVYHLTNNPPEHDEICDKDGAALIQREDDLPQTVTHRLEIYGEVTKPLIDFYQTRGLLYSVDAMGSSEAVFGRLLEILS